MKKKQKRNRPADAAVALNPKVNCKMLRTGIGIPGKRPSRHLSRVLGVLLRHSELFGRRLRQDRLDGDGDNLAAELGVAEGGLHVS